MTITDMLARFFDPDWYSAISGGRFHPSTGIDHYLTEGWRLYLSPSPYFDAKFYLGQIDGFGCCELDALTCFLEHGEARGDRPHPLIDPKWIRGQLDQDALLDADYGGSAVLWYLETGWKTEIRPHPLFWSDWYRARYSVNAEPLLHYINTGHGEGNCPNPLFDTKFYALSMKGRLGGLDPLSHYVLFGYRELASPHPLVDLPFVAERLELRAPVTRDLLADYLAGQSDVEPSFYVDPQYYWSKAGEPTRFAVVNGKRLALVDFAERNGGISPHPHFSSSWYLKQRGDVRAAGLNPLSHYLSSGWRERASPHPLFDTNYYLSTYPDVVEIGQEPLRHFLTGGWREGRKARAPQPIMTSVRRYGGTQTVSIGQDVQNVVSHGRAPDTSRLSVGVFAHVFYEELAADFAELANHIRPPCQVFITTDHYAKVPLIRQAFLHNSVHDFEIRVTPNRGRDIAPMLIGYNDRLKSVDIGLHIHTKRSKHYARGFEDWRDYLLKGNVGTKMVVDNTLALFAHSEIGAVAPKEFQPISPLINWGMDFSTVSRLLSLVGETIYQDSLLEFPSGSMFWFRTTALADLVDLGLDLAHFDPEEGQIDGTLAHALERAFLYFVEHAGYGWIRTELAAPGAAQQVNLEDLPVVRIMPPHRIFGGISAHFPECRPFAPRRAQSKKPRLNLLLPTVEADRAHGGVATALEMYKALLQAFDGRVDGRMISTDASFSNKFLPPSDHTVLGPVDSDVEDANVVLDGTLREMYYLDVRPNDFFLASAWWNAAAALEIIDWQRRCFPKSRSKLVYLVQDFEPGFYPWSTKYALAQATYLHSEVTIPVFNTTILAGSFHSRGLFHSTEQFVLQPSINREITDAISPGTAKERIVLLYLRPEVLRNCYEFLDALVYRITSSDEKYWSNWRFVAVGENLAASPFKCSDSIEKLGKISLSDYGQLLSRSAIGVSLMISPHPSYPPLEMAEAGMRVITNSYENKNLSALHENITSFDRFDMDEVAALLTNIAQQWETDPQAGWRSKPKVDWFFGSLTNLPDVAGKIAELLGADWRAPRSRPRSAKRKHPAGSRGLIVG